MADITGTEGADILQGTNIDTLLNDRNSGADIINALGGDDRIIGSTGRDTIDGGAGNDTLDFSTVDRNIFLSYNGFGINSSPESRRVPPEPSENAIDTRLTNIEKIIGNPNKSNTIQDFSRYPFPIIKGEVDLSKNRLTSYDLISGAATIFTIENFDNISVGITGILVGNDRNNKISGSSSTIIGSKGNDELSGTTLDYSNLGRIVKFSLSENNALGGKVDKGNFGTDTVTIQTKIVGSSNKNNTIDGNSLVGASFNINLATNSLLLNGSDNKQFEVVNFVNAIGTKGDDTIVGANKNSTLTGGGGNDCITGGTKNDRITGTNSTARGVGEVDTLTGGGGKDKFVLGDKNGAYYVGNGGNDYATITDFNIFQDSIDLGNFKNYSFALEGNNTINLFSGKDVNNRDLIAKIQISGGLSSVASNSRSVMGSSPNLDAIVSKIDVLSGANFNADTVI